MPLGDDGERRRRRRCKGQKRSGFNRQVLSVSTSGRLCFVLQTRLEKMLILQERRFDWSGSKVMHRLIMFCPVAPVCLLLEEVKSKSSVHASEAVCAPAKPQMPKLNPQLPG